VPISQTVNVSDDVKRALRAQEGTQGDLSEIARRRVMGIPLNDFSTAGIPYDPTSYDTSALRTFGDPRGNLPYDPRQQTSNVQQYQDERGSLPFDPRRITDVNAYTDKVGDAVFEQGRRRLDPVWSQAYERQQQDLANRGLPVGGEAYNKASAELNRNRDDAYADLANRATMAAGGEATRLLGMEQGVRNQAFSEGLQTNTQANNSEIQRLQSQGDIRRASYGEEMDNYQRNRADQLSRIQLEQGLRGTAVNDLVRDRNQNVNEISALLTGNAALQTPNAPGMQSYNLQAPDMVGLHNQQYQGQMNAYNAQLQNQSSMWGGIGNMAMTGVKLAAAPATGGASMAMGKSSKTYKHKDGEPPEMLARVEQLPVRTWVYRPEIDPRQEVHIGPYAEDWRDILGLGNGKEIALLDAFGVSLKCIQEMHERVKDLEAEVASLKKGR
jgi:hypothetical protein